MGYNSLILIVAIIIKSYISKETKFTNQTQLIIHNGEFKKEEINVTYLNNQNPSVMYFSKGKVWYVKGEEDFTTIKDYFRISRAYIFLVNELNLLEKLLATNIENIIFSGVIIPNRTEFNDEKVRTFLNSFSNKSVFMHESPNLDSLLLYDIKTERGNYFFSFNYSIILFSTPLIFIKWSSGISLLIIVLAVCLWTLKQKYTPPDSILSLHKTMIFIPYMGIIVCVLIFCQVFTITNNGQTHTASSIYIETAMITMRAIFRTMLWFFLIIVPSGWQISYQNLNRAGLKTFIKVFIFIYVAVCIDQIIDAFSGMILQIFFPSEIKNIIFYLIMLIGVLYAGIKTLKLLKSKLRYAAYLANDYIPALLIKIKLIKYHIISVAIYCLLYFIVMTIQKVVFPEYTVAEFSLVNYNMLDVLLIVFCMFIYQPKEIPPLYLINFGDDIVENNGHIYCAQIRKINEIQNKMGYELSKSDLKVINKDIKNEEHSVFIIINPVFSHQDDNKKETLNIVIDKISVGFVLP